MYFHVLYSLITERKLLASYYVEFTLYMEPFLMIIFHLGKELTAWYSKLVFPMF